MIIRLDMEMPDRCIKCPFYRGAIPIHNGANTGECILKGIQYGDSLIYDNCVDADCPLSENFDEEINNLINENIAYNEFDYIKEKGLKFKQKNKAEGLENVLYYCPKCHKEFTLSTSGNTIKCDHCGFELEIKEDYH